MCHFCPNLIYFGFVVIILVEQTIMKTRRQVEVLHNGLWETEMGTLPPASPCFCFDAFISLNLK